MLKEFEYTIKESEIKYNDGTGNMAIATKLILRAPSNNQLQSKYADRLKQAVMRAFFELESKRTQKTEEDITRAKLLQNDEAKEPSEEEQNKAEGMLMILNASSIDISALKKDFFDLLMDGACFVEGKILINRGQIENQLTYSEANILLGEYISHFLVSSALNKKAKKI